MKKKLESDNIKADMRCSQYHVIKNQDISEGELELELKLFNKVQETKYKVLREVAYQTWKGNDAFAEFNEIASEVIPKDEPPQTCCIYKDRAVVAERIRLALGGSRNNKNIVQVIKIACDECPEAGYVVTDLCRGCLAHSCKQACKRGAITTDEHQHATIDKSKCVECGKCAKECPYGAIHNFQRPCERSCKVGAISMGPGGEATIDEEKCISCGACVYQCPFGATVDVSSILSIIKEIKKAEDNCEKGKMIAIVAPSIASQFLYASLGQVITGIKKLGFDEVLEVAVGAEMVAYKEGLELKEKGFLTSSCCPAFVKYIETKHPKMAEHISHNLSPMAELAKHVKEKKPDSVIVFIGPCIAKKAEVRKGTVSPYVDYVMTFEELQALFDSRDILLKEQELTEWNQASYYGRMFARTGGLAAAVEQTLKELEIDDFEYKPVVCQGIDQCKTALLKATKGALDGNFIEGMACIGGCVGGSGNPARHEEAPREMREHIEDAENTSIMDNVRKAINIY